ncbi:alpha/beta hydrolase [Martelella mediterranea]|uniref:Acetyl esterase/lipase n=1 Tax=Martelella mediterranea TaxID=293089 RepID=A0A4R3NQT3_9HYPH|nr:alpha/beta hydrolase [Martelella mediterranea]TCT37634.1 acetyl esterase/lipase [Martelella mediterranea]
MSGAGLRDEQVIPLWHGTPEGTPDHLQMVVTERSPSLFRTDRVITGISAPSLTAIVPQYPNGVSLIAAPGGGYQRIAADAEGYRLGQHLASLGVTTFIMTYRLPGEGHENASDVPLADAQRAMRQVRGNALSWGLDPHKILFMGYSAAGHMAASLATAFDREVYRQVDHLDEISARPDFLALVYPVITMFDPFVHEGSRQALLGNTPDDETKAAYTPDRHVGPDTPQTFMVLADDDTSVPAENALGFYAALRRHRVPAELHIYRDGGHGFKAAGKDAPALEWHRLLIGWMRMTGLLKA